MTLNTPNTTLPVHVDLESSLHQAINDGMISKEELLAISSNYESLEKNITEPTKTKCKNLMKEVVVGMLKEYTINDDSDLEKLKKILTSLNIAYTFESIDTTKYPQTVKLDGNTIRPLIGIEGFFTLENEHSLDMTKLLEMRRSGHINSAIASGINAAKLDATDIKDNIERLKQYSGGGSKEDIAIMKGIYDDIIYYITQGKNRDTEKPIDETKFTGKRQDMRAMIAHIEYLMQEIPKAQSQIEIDKNNEQVKQKELQTKLTTINQGISKILSQLGVRNPSLGEVPPNLSSGEFQANGGNYRIDMNTTDGKIHAFDLTDKKATKELSIKGTWEIGENTSGVTLDTLTTAFQNIQTAITEKTIEEKKQAEKLALDTLMGGVTSIFQEPIQEPKQTTSTVRKHAATISTTLQTAPNFATIKPILELLVKDKDIKAFQSAIGATPIDGQIGSRTIMALLTKAGIGKTNDLFQIFDARKKSEKEIKMSENANKSNEDGSNEKKPPVEKNPKAQESSKEKPKTKESIKTQDEIDIENLNKNIKIAISGLGPTLEYSNFTKWNEGYTRVFVSQKLSDNRSDGASIAIEKKDLLDNKDFTKELPAISMNDNIYGITISRKKDSKELNIHFTKNKGIIRDNNGEYNGGINDAGKVHGEGVQKWKDGDTWIGKWKDGQFHEGKKENKQGEVKQIIKNGKVVCSEVSECDAFEKTEQIDAYLLGRKYTKDPKFIRSYFNRDKDLWIYVDSNNKVHAEKLGLRQYNPFALINDQEKLHTLEVAQILATKRIKNKTN